MFDEPDADGFLALHVVNDTSADTMLRYRVSDALTDETLCAASGLAVADESRILWKLSTQPDEQRFYRIEWTLADGTTGQNHYMTGLKNLDLAKYRDAMRRCGFRVI